MRDNVRDASYERIVLALGKLLALLLIARTWGAEAQGTFVLLTSTWALAARFSLFGFEISNNLLGAKMSGNREAGALVGNTLLFGGLAGSASAGVLLLIVSYTPWIPTISRVFLPVLVVGAFLATIQSSIGGLLYGFRDFRFHFLGITVQYTVFLLALGLSALENAGNALFISWAWVTSLGLVTVVWAAVALFRARWRISFSLQLLRQQLSFGIKAYAFGVSHMLNLRLDAFMIAFFLGAGPLGIYSIAVAATEVVLFVPKALTNALLTEASGTGKVPTGVFRALSSVLFLTVLASAISSPWLVVILFGSEFAAAVIPLEILLIGTYSMGLGITVAHYFFGLNETRIPIIAALASLLLTGLLDFLLIPLWGILGAAVASVIAYSTFALILLSSLRRREGVSMCTLLVPSPEEVRVALRAVVTSGLTHFQGRRPN